MITYEKDNQVALITLIYEHGYILDVFLSFDNFLSGDNPIETFKIDDSIDYNYIETVLLPGWTRIQRNDNTWEKIIS